MKLVSITGDSGKTLENSKAMANHNRHSHLERSRPQQKTTVEGNHLAVSPDGQQIAIPKELFVALWDFMEGRKPSGSITLQFRDGAIVSVEAMAKKTFRNG